MAAHLFCARRPLASDMGRIAPCTHGVRGRQVAGLLASLSCAFAPSLALLSLAIPLREDAFLAGASQPVDRFRSTPGLSQGVNTLRDGNTGIGPRPSGSRVAGSGLD